MPEIGCDICKVSRFEKQPAAFAARILSVPEQERFESLSGKRQLEYLAGRFAARESIIKASGRGFAWRSLTILNDEKGRPYVRGLPVSLSISHESEYAIAVAIWDGEHE